MIEGLTRVVGGVRERLCWRFLVHGRMDPTYEPTSGSTGPFDADRRRCLKRGETFQRLDHAGRPRTYQGLSWRPEGALRVEHGAVAEALGDVRSSASAEPLRADLPTAERALEVAEGARAARLTLEAPSSRAASPEPGVVADDE